MKEISLLDKKNNDLRENDKEKQEQLIIFEKQY